MRVYVGSRYESQIIVSVRHNNRLTPQTDLPASNHIRNHSPDGYEWGYCGSGPAQLALSLLLDATGCQETAERLYQKFKYDCVSMLAFEQWTLTQEEVLAWVAAHPSTLIV